VFLKKILRVVVDFDEDLYLRSPHLVTVPGSQVGPRSGEENPQRLLRCTYELQTHRVVVVSVCSAVLP